MPINPNPNIPNRPVNPQSPNDDAESEESIAKKGWKNALNQWAIDRRERFRQWRETQRQKTNELRSGAGDYKTLLERITPESSEGNPVYILTIFGLTVWLLEFIVFRNTGSFLPNYVYFPMHILMGSVALAVLGKKSAKPIVFVTLFYILLPFLQHFIDTYAKSLIFRFSEDVGHLVLEFLLTPLAWPIWFFYGLRKSKSKLAHAIAILMILTLAVGVIAAAMETASYQELISSLNEKTGTTVTRKTILTKAQEAWNSIPKSFERFKKNIALEQERTLEYATAGYYEGKVEENAKEKLGVFIEQIKPAQTSFFDDEEITLWTTLKAKTLDEKNPIKIQLECVSGDEESPIKGEIQPEQLEKEGFILENYEEIDVACKFTNDKVKSLDIGSHEVNFLASFNFPTQAYLKTYFMDKEKKRALLKEGIDVLKQYGITDTNPVAIFTSGPVKIGAETTKSLPIGIAKGYPVLPRLGITIENQWEGKIEKINSIKVQTPDGITLAHCPVTALPKQESDSQAINSYEFRLNDPSVGKTEGIEKFISLNCVMDVNPEKVLGNTPIATKYIRIESNYKYQIETRFNLEIKKAKTPEEEQYDEALNLDADNFVVNLNNIKTLTKHIEEVISINSFCLEGKSSNAQKVIESSKIFSKEDKPPMKSAIISCMQDKKSFSSIAIDKFLFASSNLVLQSEKAKSNIKGIGEASYAAKKDELNLAISQAVSSINKAVSHLDSLSDVPIPEDTKKTIVEAAKKTIAEASSKLTPLQ